MPGGGSKILAMRFLAISNRCGNSERNSTHSCMKAEYSMLPLIPLQSLRSVGACGNLPLEPSCLATMWTTHIYQRQPVGPDGDNRCMRGFLV